MTSRRLEGLTLDLLLMSLLDQVNYIQLTLFSGLIIGVGIGYKLRKMIEYKERFDKVLKVMNDKANQLLKAQEHLNFVTNFGTPGFSLDSSFKERRIDDEND